MMKLPSSVVSVSFFVPFNATVTMAACLLSLVITVPFMLPVSASFSALTTIVINKLRNNVIAFNKNRLHIYISFYFFVPAKVSARCWRFERYGKLIYAKRKDDSS